MGTQRLSSPCAAPPLHRGHVVIWDDGSLQGLAPALAHVTRITGSLILLGGVAFGSDLDQPGLTNFEGLGSLQVGGWGPLAAQQVQGAAAAVPWVMRRKHRAKAMPENTVAKKHRGEKTPCQGHARKHRGCHVLHSFPA